MDKIIINGPCRLEGEVEIGVHVGVGKFTGAGGDAGGRCLPD